MPQPWRCSGQGLQSCTRKVCSLLVSGVAQHYVPDRYRHTAATQHCCDDGAPEHMCVLSCALIRRTLQWYACMSCTDPRDALWLEHGAWPTALMTAVVAFSSADRLRQCHHLSRLPVCAAVVLLDRFPAAAPPPGQLIAPSPPPIASLLRPPALVGALPCHGVTPQHQRLRRCLCQGAGIRLPSVRAVARRHRRARRQ